MPNQQWRDKSHCQCKITRKWVNHYHLTGLLTGHTFPLLKNLVHFTGSRNMLVIAIEAKGLCHCHYLLTKNLKYLTCMLTQLDSTKHTKWCQFSINIKLLLVEVLPMTNENKMSCNIGCLLVQFIAVLQLLVICSRLFQGFHQAVGLPSGKN